MDLSLPALTLMCGLFLLVAFLYSSVGHGGASGYLAVMSLFALPPNEMASTALVLNILVAGIACIAYFRAGHFSLRLTLPFLLLSIPFAFLGGTLHVSARIYLTLLAIALVAASIRLIVRFEKPGPSSSSTAAGPAGGGPALGIALPTGAGIGLVSGLVGVGGGIFLSPLMLLLRWADPKKTAAASAFFIVANSVAGIFGRAAQGNFSASGASVPFLAAALLGGVLGARWGATKYSHLTLRRLLGIALLLAAGKILLSPH